MRFRCRAANVGTDGIVVPNQTRRQSAVGLKFHKFCRPPALSWVISSHVFGIRRVRKTSLWLRGRSQATATFGTLCGLSWMNSFGFGIYARCSNPIQVRNRRRFAGSVGQGEITSPTSQTVQCSSKRCIAHQTSSGSEGGIPHPNHTKPTGSPAPKQ